jgi:hypothetical protein
MLPVTGKLAYLVRTDVASAKQRYLLPDTAKGGEQHDWDGLSQDAVLWSGGSIPRLCRTVRGRDISRVYEVVNRHCHTT